MQQTIADSSIKVCFVLGCPGAGKGTLCSMLASESPIYHLSTGDYLRSLSRGHDGASSLEGIDCDELSAYLERRDLLPAEIIVDILAKKIKRESQKGKDTFLIDGFPRSEETAEFFEKTVCPPTSVIHIDCERDEAKLRFVQRARGNDDAEIFDRRYSEFERNNPAILNRYSKNVKVVDANAGTSTAYEQLVAYFREYL